MHNHDWHFMSSTLTRQHSLLPTKKARVNYRRRYVSCEYPQSEKSTLLSLSGLAQSTQFLMVGAYKRRAFPRMLGYRCIDCSATFLHQFSSRPPRGSRYLWWQYKNRSYWKEQNIAPSNMTDPAEFSDQGVWTRLLRQLFWGMTEHNFSHSVLFNL